jgi:hypothetical protein
VTHAFVALSTGLRMHVAEAGNPDAPPVLLLHGCPQHWWEWRKVIPPLAERYRVFAPRPARRWLDGRAGRRVHRGPGSRRRARAARHARAPAGRARRPRLQCIHRVPALLRPPGTCRGLSCLGPQPTCVSSRRCSPVSRSCGSSRLSPRRAGPSALPTDRLARHLLARPPRRPTRSPMRTWWCSPDASTRRGTLRPGRRTGTSSSRRLAVSWPRRRRQAAAAHSPDRLAHGRR